MPLATLAAAFAPAIPHGLVLTCGQRLAVNQLAHDLTRDVVNRQGDDSIAAQSVGDRGFRIERVGIVLTQRIGQRQRQLAAWPRPKPR